MMMPHPALAMGAAALLVLQGPLMTRLRSQTVEAFTAYSQAVKKDVESRIDAPGVQFEAAGSALRSVIAGDVVVRPRLEGNPVAVPDGLIHDWTGDVFIPRATARAVVAVLQDFDHHAQIYPDMTRSHLLRRNGDRLSGIWRMTRTAGLATVTLDIYNDAEYRSPARGKWLCEAHTPRISQVDDAGSKNEKALPDNTGYGFLWRLDAFWLIEERDGGVLVECRTLSLSRGIPNAVEWMIKPFVDRQPRDALRSTLEATRTAVEQRTQR